ncbi:aldehyde dehydrogenase family protein [Noviherbaspirillum autotrophicum]|uniref:Aldehyde dehydrogenase n=1 Tax=Noviherbaspirillum autotrophicum TaxID=709839 RepID=A0A0C2BPN8_9BURK|nr:aldehyde dehydrogenase family protein [Noviherbaspirillum autotrophicum]KIF83265.1 aldehyde dehydrogenase [Noviherbaspirillum autotrophicum]
MKIHQHLYIGGKWVKPHGKMSADVTHSATEQVIGRICLGNEQDAGDAAYAARDALDSWSATPPAERADWLRKIHGALRERSEQIAALISQEVGSPLRFSRQVQASLPAATFGIHADLLRDFHFAEQVGNSEVLREPAGVVACITPWNYPLHQIAAKLAPALAAGCTVVLKPSEVAPLNAFLFADIIDELGFPAGVFNLVSGTGETVGEALACHPQVDMISFTGSTRTGKRVAMLAAQTFKRVTLELGGKSAAILLDDADYVQAVPGAMRACFLNAGQTCSAHTRMLVPETRYEQVAAMAAHLANEMRVGDPFDERTELGPLVSERQRERVRHFIRAGIEEGAALLAGGPHPPPGLEQGYFVQPTVFGGVQQGMLIEQEEVFGPVLAILSYRDEQDAIRIANESAYGLSGGVWSRDVAHARRVALRMRTGQVDINGGHFNIMAPFGGCKQSGNGRELGRYGIEEFLQYKSLQYPVPATA